MWVQNVFNVKNINASQSSLSPWGRRHYDLGVPGPFRIPSAAGPGVGPRNLCADGQVSVIQAKFGQGSQGQGLPLSPRLKFQPCG